MSNINYQPLYDLIKSVSIEQLPEIIEHAISVAGKRIGEEYTKAKERLYNEEQSLSAIEAIAKKLDMLYNASK